MAVIPPSSVMTAPVVCLAVAFREVTGDQAHPRSPSSRGAGLCLGP